MTPVNRLVSPSAEGDFWGPIHCGLLHQVHAASAVPTLISHRRCGYCPGPTTGQWPFVPTVAYPHSQHHPPDRRAIETAWSPQMNHVFRNLHEASRDTTQQEPAVFPVQVQADQWQKTWHPGEKGLAGGVLVM